MGSRLSKQTCEQLSFETLADWRTHTADAAESKKPQVVGARLPEVEFDTLEAWRKETLFNRARAEVLGVMIGRWMAIMRHQGLMNWSLERVVDLMWVLSRVISLLRVAGLLEQSPEIIVRSLRIEAA